VGVELAREMNVGNRIYSSHQPLEVEINEVNKRIIEGQKGKEKVIVK